MVHRMEAMEEAMEEATEEATEEKAAALMMIEWTGFLDSKGTNKTYKYMYIKIDRLILVVNWIEEYILR